MPGSIAFIGAGASRAFGIPTMTEMTDRFEARLRDESSPHIELFDDIKRQLKYYPAFDIEALITVLEAINDGTVTEAFRHPSVHYFSNWYQGFDRMVEGKKNEATQNKSKAEQLLQRIKKFIAESCEVVSQEFDVYDAFFQQALMHGGYDLSQELASNGEKKGPVSYLHDQL